jgi:putative transposase
MCRTEFLRMLARHRLRGVGRVISDSHEALKAAITKVLHVTWQRCRLHLIHNFAGSCRASGLRRRLRPHRNVSVR